MHPLGAAAGAPSGAMRHEPESSFARPRLRPEHDSAAVRATRHGEPLGAHHSAVYLDRTDFLERQDRIDVELGLGRVKPVDEDTHTQTLCAATPYESGGSSRIPHYPDTRHPAEDVAGLEVGSPSDVGACQETSGSHHLPLAESHTLESRRQCRLRYNGFQLGHAL